MIISKPHNQSRKKTPKKPEDPTFIENINQFKSGWVKEISSETTSSNKVKQTKKIDSLEDFKSVICIDNKKSDILDKKKAAGKFIQPSEPSKNKLTFAFFKTDVNLIFMTTTNSSIPKNHNQSKNTPKKKPEKLLFVNNLNTFKDSWVKETSSSKASSNKVKQTKKIESLAEFKKAKKENLTSIDVFMENISFFRKRQNLDVFTYLLSRLHTNENLIFDGLKTIAAGALGDERKYKTVGRILKKIEGMGLLKTFLDQSFFKMQLVKNKKKHGYYFDSKSCRANRIAGRQQASRNYRLSLRIDVGDICHAVAPIEMLIMLRSIVGVNVVRDRRRILTVINMLSSFKLSEQIRKIYDIKAKEELYKDKVFKRILEHARKPFKIIEKRGDDYYIQMYKEALNCLYKAYLRHGAKFLKYHLYKMKKYVGEKGIKFKNTNHFYAYISNAIFNMIIADNKRRRKFAIKRAKELEPVPI